MISQANVQTVIVVGFVLSLLALVLAIFNSYKISSGAEVAADWLEHYATSSAELQAEVSDLRAKVGALESELTELRNQRENARKILGPQNTPEPAASGE